MPNVTKIVFIGAGSAAFSLSMYRDLFTSRDLAGSTLTLVDTNAEALRRSGDLAEALNRRGGAGIIIERTTDRRSALDGAGFVVNSVAIERNRLWKLDFEVPKKHGIRHTLGENGGPGGLFFTLRTMPLIFDIARDVEALCPDALFINLSNPESRIVLGLSRYSRVRPLGLCHGLFLARWFICQILGMTEADVDLWGAGLNHFQWVMHLRDRQSGRDLYPLLREREKTHDPSFTPLVRKLFRAFGLWPSCSDDHTGEFLPYGWEAGEHGFDFTEDERGRGILKDLMDGVIDGSRTIPEDWLTPSWGERAVAVIEAILHNRKRFIEAGIVRNQGVIPNLPADVAVEVPVMADAAGIHPISLGPLPQPIANLLSIQAGVQQLAVEAAIHASKELALQALLIDPVINSATAAAEILDELWEANRDYIRPCV
ncbi:alpha-glucosidase/alpha-galactosidase [Telmatospirillum siberiense]|uniref:Alpha-glucosidase/alpha-galactosidase n=1 Tax=Telmatospirillum siberiense TaxID=382514 RepID=A0A2N3PZH8_9PROT|nr:alpha-glucosidase/alpha-galactosidase [Telmatospirillum siberiense]PKU25814.1 alpha-glucosidase/alpha-galactosidase [Telmatospirillum siberiense]